MNYGVIDVGSNTVRLCVYDVSADGKKFKTIMNRKTMAGLASYVRDGEISEEGIDVAAESIGKCLKRASYLKPVRVDVFATAVLRNISNSAQAIAAIEEADCSIVLLSEEDEAHLGFVGASSQDTMENGVLVDIGGGSSEVTLIANSKDVMRASLPRGVFVIRTPPCFRYSSDRRRNSHPSGGEVRALLEADAHGMAEHRVRRLFGVGGSIRALAEVNARMLDDGASDKDMTHEDVDRLVSTTFSKDGVRSWTRFCTFRRSACTRSRAAWPFLSSFSTTSMRACCMYARMACVRDTWSIAC